MPFHLSVPWYVMFIAARSKMKSIQLYECFVSLYYIINNIINLCEYDYELIADKWTHLFLEVHQECTHELLCGL